MLDEIIGTKIDISVFDKNYNNDKTGASAVPPAALLKLIIYGYSIEPSVRGCISSRKLDELNENNIVASCPQDRRVNRGYEHPLDRLQ